MKVNFKILISVRILYCRLVAVTSMARMVFQFDLTALVHGYSRGVGVQQFRGRFQGELDVARELIEI